MIILTHLGLSKCCVACIPQVKVNNSVTPQFTEGPVNADFSGVLQVEVPEMIFLPLSLASFAKHNIHLDARRDYT